MNDVYGRYLEALLEGDFEICAEIVQKALDGDSGVKEIYLDLFQRSLYEVGRLWETNEISVATEHLATALTERLMALVAPRVFAAEHVDRTAIVTCAANEFHQIGGRMVADTFEMNRWHARFLGANTPVEDLVAMVEDQEPDVLALSLNVHFNLPGVVETIEAVRKVRPALPIVAGGQAFRNGESMLGDDLSGVSLLLTLGELESYLEDFR